ncbi:plasmid stabilization system [Verminephrobacter eiseniae EF01-2]|uniref:Plasmid stabilization system n=2 Tax=Verminephrobacter eiseniae TaxID=364317 RepID=A1WLS9_VEREI|nr:plasmid stabilization system [Verminephrobacter eiseniae EF01-2]
MFLAGRFVAVDDQLPLQFAVLAGINQPLDDADGGRQAGRLEEIWLYTLKHWSMEQADTYHHSLVAAFEGLAAGTKQGRLADVFPEFMKYLCGSHVVYFLDYADHLDVIRVLHQRQDAERHL